MSTTYGRNVGCLLVCFAAVVSLSSAAGAADSVQKGARGGVGTKYYVSWFHFVGNTVFSEWELFDVVQQYTGRYLDVLGLEQARLAVTTKYINAGYVNSGVVLDKLPGPDGLVTFRVVEGKLTQANIHGNRWLRTGFYRSRLGVGSNRPLNTQELRNELQLWRQIYPVEQVNSELRPGGELGEAILDVTVKERFPYHLGMEYANDRPPSTGSDRISALLRADSLTGNGDQLSFDYVVVRGGPGLEDPQFPGADDLSAAYVFPFTAEDTAVALSYARSSAVVVEAPFQQLNITAQSDVFGLGLSQPIVRTPTRELILSLSGQRESNRTYLLGKPYSFSPGADNGESIVSVGRLSAQFADRNEWHLFAARLTLSAGLGVLDATVNAKGPDGRFVSVLGQAQYLRRLGRSRNEIMLKVVGQYTPDPLLTLEQLAIGGANSVRGYAENLLLRDYGAYGTLEFHVPIWSNKEGRAYVQLVPFGSIGAGWNNDRPTPAPTYISSAGTGVVLTPWRGAEASFYWGYAFQDIHYTSYNPQNSGFHFKVTIWAF